MSNIHNLTCNTLLEAIVSTPVDLLEIKSRLEDKPYRVVDTGIHPKILADWNRKDLLLVKPEPNKMHRFSLTEFVWVKFIEKMREYNFPLPVIKSFRDQLFTASFDTVADEFTPDVLFDLMKDMDGIAEDPERFKAFLKNTDLGPILRTLLPEGLLSGNLLEQFIVLSLFLQTPVSFLIDKDGKGIIFNPLMLTDGAYSKEDISILFSQSFVSISLSEVLSEVLVLSDVEILHGNLMIISDAEANVLEALRDDDLLSVSIRFDKDSVMDLMEIKKGKKVEREVRLLELMLKDGYQDITVKTQHGKVVYCENTRKVKLK